MRFIRRAATLLVYATVVAAVLSGLHSRVSAQPAAPSEALRDGESEARRKAFEIRKLELETRKVENDINTWWLTPVLTAASILLAGAGIAWQTRSANNNRKQEAKADATLKLAEFVLSSRHPAMARQRLALLERIDKESFGSDLVTKVGLDHANVEFPSVERQELRIEVFKQLASNPEKSDKIRKAFSEIFPRETWIYSDATAREHTDPRRSSP